MERSKRPIKLTAGYFLTLSLATFMSVKILLYFIKLNSDREIFRW